MNSKRLTLLAGSALVLAATHELCAQYAPPPPPLPFAGFLNEALRKNDPYMNVWDISGALRLRYEDHEAYAIAGSPGTSDFRDHGANKSNDYFLARLRVHVAYSEKWWSAYVEGRSSLENGDERFASAAPVPRTGHGPESDQIDLHQAYVMVGNHKEFPLSAKVGRQELSYGEERLVGAFGWNNIGRVFDAAKVRWQNAWFGVDFFASRVVIPEDQKFNVSNDYEWFSGFYATSTKIPKHTLDFYFLARNASASAALAEPSPQFGQPSARDIGTVGVRIKSLPGQIGPWDYSFEGAGQFGTYQDSRIAGSPRRTQKAFMSVAQLGYTFTETWATPRLGLEFDYASGDSDPTDGTHGTFDNLFPTNHKFYGHMDMASLQNIEDLSAIFQLKPHPRLSMALEGHAFWLADTHDNFYSVTGAARGGVAATPGTAFGINPGYGSFVGTEFSVTAGYALTRFAQVEAGYGHFFHGDYIAQSLSAPAVGARDADFVYVQLGINF